jgi:hypothetical protein
MKNPKNYIGKGKEGNFGTVRVNINLNDAESFIHKSENGEKYLTFFVSKTKEADRFKNTHTVYCLDPQNETAQETSVAASATPAPKKRRAKKA